MFQKKYKQFLAATLSAAMLIGQVQYANAAEIGENVIDLSEEDFELAPTEDAPELTVEDVQEYLDTDEDFEFGEVELPADESEDVSEDVVDEEFGEVLNEDSIDEIELIDWNSDEEFTGEDATLEDEDTVQAVGTEIPEGIVGMAEDYELTESELSIKEDAIAKKDTYFVDFASLTEGKDYVKDEVVFLTETKEHAEEVAAAYAGTLKSFDNGVAVIDLSESEVSVEAAYSCAFIEGLNLPVVTPNYVFAAGELTQVDNEYLGLTKENAAEDAAELTEDETLEVTEDVETADFEEEEDASEVEEEDAEDAELEDADAEEVSEAEATEEEEKLFNDPYLFADSDEYQWHHNMIDSYSAWMDLGKEGLAKTSEVVVAVIDDGVADIAELNVTGETEADGNHGTLVAGVIGAALDENGGAGVAPGVQVLSLKSDFTAASVMTQLRVAVSKDANVINMSFGGSYIDPQLQSVIDEVYAAGVTMVAAVGEGVAYPAACEKVIAVAAVNEAGKVASYVADASYADIAAPGSNIWTTDVDGNYVMVSGSALASSVVAGAAALYVVKYGSVAPKAVKNALVDSADVTEEANIVNVRSLLNAAAVNVNGSPEKLKAGFKPKKIFIYQGSTEVKKGIMGTVKSGSINKTQDFYASTDNGQAVRWTWSSSAEKKATITTSGSKVTVTSRGIAGTIKLTAVSEGKKRSFSIKIINPVSGTMYMEYPANQYTNILANGGYYKIKAKTQSANTLAKKPTTGKVKWLAVVRTSSGNVLSEKEAKKVATASNGKVSAKKGAWKWLNKNGYSGATIYPVAYSTDGTNFIWKFENLNSGNAWALTLTLRPMSPFGFAKGASYTMSRRSSPQVYTEFIVETRRGFFTVSRKVSYIVCYTPFYVVSDNTNVLNVSCQSGSYNGRTVYGIRFAPTGNSGTAHVTVMTKDGTHLKSTSTWILK